MKSDYVASAFVKEIHFDHEIDAPVSCKTTENMKTNISTFLYQMKESFYGVLCL